MSRGRTALRYGLWGFFGFPVVILTIVVLINLSSPRCGSSSGGCGMAAFFAAVVSSVPGLLIGAALGAFMGDPRDEEESSSTGPGEGGTAT